jgi:predicted PurR-regulated permease PerM
MPLAPAPDPSASDPLVPTRLHVKGVFVYLLVLLTVVGVTALVIQIRAALLLSLGAGMMAVALNHLVELLCERKMRRPWAIALVCTLWLAFLTGLCLIVVVPTVGQVRALVEQPPDIQELLKKSPIFQSLDPVLDLGTQLKEMSTRAKEEMPWFSAAGGLLAGASTLLWFLVLTIFMLVFAGDWGEAFLAETNEVHRERLERVAAKIYRSVGGYLTGLLTLCGINAAMTTTFLGVMHTPFFLPLGILSGMSSTVPYVGPTVVAGVVTVIQLAASGPWAALVTAIYFLLYGQLEGNLLAPVIFKRTAHVNPLLTLVSIFFFGELMGVVGSILAVPIAATGQILLRELLAMRREPERPEVASPAPVAAQPAAPSSTAATLVSGPPAATR